jgi:hypothetical protein
MHQGRGLERLPRLLLSESSGRQFSKLVVHQRQQPIGGLRITLIDLNQDTRHLAHGAIVRRSKAHIQTLATRKGPTLPLWWFSSASSKKFTKKVRRVLAAYLLAASIFSTNSLEKKWYLLTHI